MSERRGLSRLRFAEPIIARFGSSVVLVIDISPGGAKIEHYSRMERGLERPLRVQWGNDSLGINATVVRSRLERMVAGDEGVTVYRSGLKFDESQTGEVEHIRKVIDQAVAASLVEQVANARGFETRDMPEMPIFRQGILTRNDPQLDQKLDRHVRSSRHVRQSGYYRFSLTKRGWRRTWTLNPEQPDEGFTISAEEPEKEITLLCETYKAADEESRNLIRKLAEASVEMHRAAAEGDDRRS